MPWRIMAEAACPPEVLLLPIEAARRSAAFFTVSASTAGESWARNRASLMFNSLPPEVSQDAHRFRLHIFAYFKDFFFAGGFFTVAPEKSPVETPAPHQGISD